jgi:predicted DNA-binding protein
MITPVRMLGVDLETHKKVKNLSLKTGKKICFLVTEAINLLETKYSKNENN